MDWPKFFLWNLLGAIVWVTVISGIGYFVGSNWETLLRVVKHLHLSVIVVAAALALLIWWRRRRASGQRR
jgi:membrane-associated protein